MTPSSDIHVILPAGTAAPAPRQALRAANGNNAIVVVISPGDVAESAERLALPVREGRADAVFGGRHRIFGPGAGSFALRRETLERLEITEAWPEVGYEVAAQVTATGGRVLSLDDKTPVAPPRIGTVLRTKARWSKPVVWRRDRLERRRTPEDWDASDTELASTLDNLDGAVNYAAWIVALMAPYLSGRILEVGAGHGTFTNLLARYGSVTATELSERAVALLEERYEGSDRVTVVHADELKESAFDTAVMVNVLEHIDDDVGALCKLRDDLRPGGHVLIYSPAFNALYSRFDAAVGHHRRYTKASLVRAMDDAGLEVVEARYVNAPGALAWYVVATRLGRRPTEGWSTRLYDRAAVPVARRVEQWITPPFGQSLLVVSAPAGRAVATIVVVMPGSPCLTVVMPCYNEASTVADVVKQVLESPYTQELLVVDDGSTDGTRELLAAIDDAKVRVLLQPVNQGKGAALRRGFAEAMAPYVIVQDADLEYDPQDYAEVLGPLLDGRADVVYGSRFLAGRPHRVLYYWHSVGNRLLTTVSNMFTNLNLTDMETCYKACRREVIQSITIEEDRFGFEPEFTAKVARAGWRVYEVGISYSGRTYAEGKKIGWRDGLRAFFCIVAYSKVGERFHVKRLSPYFEPRHPVATPSAATTAAISAANPSAASSSPTRKPRGV